MTDYNVKFGFKKGENLVHATYQPDGTGRGVENQPLYEIRPTGYYRAESALPLEDGDVVLIYDNENVYWEDEPVVVLTEENVLYEGEQVYYEGAMVFDFDSVSLAPVNWTGKVVGQGEFTFASKDVSNLVQNISNTVIAQQRVDTHLDETEPAKEIVVIKNL